ncbi:MAG: zf-HC2 domain-containing protein [Vicinamibacterales bacterium]
MTHAQAVETRAAERYLLDEMPELERYAFEAHYFECAECAEDVRMGGLMRDGVRERLLGEAERGRQKADGPRQKAEGWGRVLPWAVAASLALAVGYQQLWLVPELRSQIPSSQGLSPITLRSATRGGEPAVARPTTGVLTLAFDFAGVPAGTRLSYDLRAADGSSVASGAAVAPSPGTPLLLLVPASAVRDAGSYVLAVRADGVAGPASADYRFTVTEQ